MTDEQKERILKTVFYKYKQTTSEERYKDAFEIWGMINILANVSKIWDMIDLLEEVQKGRWVDSGDWVGACWGEISIGKRAEAILSAIPGYVMEKGMKENG